MVALHLYPTFYHVFFAVFPSRRSTFNLPTTHLPFTDGLRQRPDATLLLALTTSSFHFYSLVLTRTHTHDAYTARPLRRQDLPVNPVPQPSTL